MFHHFHDSVHPEGQGSLSANDLEEMLDWLSREHQILNAGEYLFRLEKNTLESHQICLSFDDALCCQVDVALPVLDGRKIEAFFFVYSSPFCGDPDLLEIYRYFRTTKFARMDDFYKEFFSKAKSLHEQIYSNALKSYDESSYLLACPFYTKNDKWFRFLRDQVLGKLEYEKIMEQMMSRHGFDKEAASRNLWMNDQDIRELHGSGHIVGMHSYSHPTVMHKLTAAQQQLEYEKNFEHLRSVLASDPIAMSHPCGNYNEDTLNILKKLGIRIGFRSNNSITGIRSRLEVPRNNHANVYREMKK